MKLSIKDRIILIYLVSGIKGRYIEMLLIKAIIASIEFSKEEIAELGMIDGPKGPEWDPKKGHDKEVEFSEAEKSIISSRLKQLDESGDLTLELLPIWDKFFLS